MALAAEAAKEGQWQSLFNGKDLSGWVPVHEVTFGVKVIGKPASGDDSKRAFSSCAELQAFDGPR